MSPGVWLSTIYEHECILLNTVKEVKPQSQDREKNNPQPAAIKLPLLKNGNVRVCVL